MGVLNGNSPEPRRRPSRQTENGHTGTTLRRRQRTTPRIIADFTRSANGRRPDQLRRTERNSTQLKKPESRSEAPELSGWGPGGRRFKILSPRLKSPANRSWPRNGASGRGASPRTRLQTGGSRRSAVSTNLRLPGHLHPRREIAPGSGTPKPPATAWVDRRAEPRAAAFALGRCCWTTESGSRRFAFSAFSGFAVRPFEAFGFAVQELTAVGRLGSNWGPIDVERTGSGGRRR
jgi:hypothetical protein